jgi:hypothetical protein
MSSKLKRVIVIFLVLGIGIFIGWWANEIYHFAEGMRNDKAPNIDSLNQVFKIDSIKQIQK